MKTTIIKFIVLLILTVCACTKSEAQITLDGSLSTNSDEFHWRQIFGSSVILENPDSVKCKVEGIVTEGVYTFELRTSNACCYSLDSISFTAIKSTLGIVFDTVKKAQPILYDIKVTSDAKVIVTSPSYKNLTLYLYNVSGQLIQKKEVNVYKGTNYIQINKPAVKGVYILVFRSYFSSISHKFFIGE